MVFPTRPESLEQTTSKAIEPKDSKPESPIPSELARQNIPNPPPQKILKESNLEVKTKPEQNDMKTVNVAAEVFGFESVPTPEGEENMELSFNTLENETTVEESSDDEDLIMSMMSDKASSDDEDLIMSMMGGEEPQTSKTPENTSATSSPQDESSDDEDLIASMMGGDETKTSKVTENTPPVSEESLSIRRDLKLVFSMYKSFSESELEAFTNEHLNDPSKSRKITSDTGNMKNASFVHIKEANTVFMRHKPTEEHYHAFREFIQTLDLEPHEIDQLNIVHLNDSQWERTTVAIESYLNQQSKRTASSQQRSTFKNKEEATTQITPNLTRKRREADPLEQEKMTKRSKAGYDEILELQREWNQEEILREERTKERDKKSREKEHRILDKEISKTELKEEIIKRERKKP